MDCRLIVDEPASGAWNMAVDEALMESVASGGPATLRLYQWKDPTLSLGYFQPHEERGSHEPSVGLPCVRRSSGGGALVHDRELTYSLALPAEFTQGRDPNWLYCQAHRAVIDSIAELGGDPDRMSLCEPAPADGPTEDPFLCFQRRADGDLLVESPGGRDKVCGSAQRRRRGGLLQHGGVLLGRSSAAPELPGLDDLGVCRVTAEQLGEPFARNLLSRIDLRGAPGTLRERETRAAQQLYDDKHSAGDWVRRR